MADYRDISQEYAKEAVRTCLELNAGAAGVLLTQAAALQAAGLADQVKWATICLAAGAIAAAAVWFLAFSSTRYVDKSECEQSNDHLKTSNHFMRAGYVLLAVSLALFAIGCILVALGFGDDLTQ